MMKLKQGGLIVALLFLALTVVACGENATYYNIQNGKKIECTPESYSGNDGVCTWPYYKSVTSWDGPTTVLICSSYDFSDPSVCHIITPTASSPITTCIPNYVYDNLVNEGQSWVVISRQQDTNNSSSPIQVSFAATTTKTVTVTDEEQLTASLSIGVDVITTITASVQAQINHSVSQSVAVGISNSPTLSIPPGKTGYANYGVSVQITSGHLHDKAKCEGSKSDRGTDIAYVPIAAGWCLWTSDQSPSLCPSI